MFDEKPLLKRLSNDDHSALHELFKAYYRPLSAYARSIVIDDDASKDIIQDVFIKIWENRKNLLIHSSLRSFLFTCVRNTSIDYIRQNKRFSLLEQDILERLATTGTIIDKSPDAIESMIFNETSDLIDSAIEELPDQCRKIFIMSRFQGFKHKQIAEKLNLSSRTVEAHIYTALKFIRERIKSK